MRRSEQYRFKLALLNAIFISLITSGVRRYWDKNDLLHPPEIAVLFMTGFIVSITSWVLLFRAFDFKKPYKGWKLLKAVALFLLITAIASVLYVSIVSCFKNVIIESARKLTDIFQLISWGVGRCLPINAFILIIKYSSDENELKRKVMLRNEMLINENIIAKYEALKQQINPHFLFNSLNTLKSLIRLDAERSVEYVIGLSDVYRYLLKHGDNITVTLREEIGFLNAYIFLLERRFENNLTVNVDIPENYLDSLIPPVSLQILIENAVKHNVVSKARPLRIQIGIENHRILVQNNLQPRYSVEVSTGTGLGTIDHRYRLLIDKSIIINSGEKTFTVYLPIISAK